MNKILLSEVFDIEYPKTAVKSHFEKDKKGINFVSSQAANNGVAGKVKLNKDYKLYKKGSITVPLKGTVLHASLQLEDFYCAHQIAILTFKDKFKYLNEIEALYYCFAIHANKYRYNYNRQADRTLKNLLLPHPEDIPNSIYDFNFIDEKINSLTTLLAKSTTTQINKESKELVRIDEIFDVVYGVNLERNKLETDNEGVNFVSRTDTNNGVSGKVKIIPDIQPQQPPAISFAAGGSVGAAFLQLEPFYSTSLVF